MSQAFIQCPETGKPVYVGLNFEWSQLEAVDLGDKTVDCPKCGQAHRFNTDEVILRADGGG